MKLAVISLGGSVMIPEQINYNFLKKFKKELRKNYKTHKFIIVCGGGSIARKYILALEKEGKSEYELAQAGIRVTRLNALFLMKFFGKKEANDSIPLNMKEVKNALKKNNVVICGALRFEPNSTSDSTAAKLAAKLKCIFINITDVDGLFTEDPKKNPKASLIKSISWEKFEKIALHIKFKAGQHFVLDQKASKIIRKYKINTYIIGKETKNITKILKGNKFKGTLISDKEI